MESKEISLAKHLLGKIGGSERSEVLSRFNTIPVMVRVRVIDTLSTKEKELRVVVPLMFSIGEQNIEIETTNLYKAELAIWADNNLSFLDEYLRPLEFRFFREAVMRATGPA